LTSEKGKGLQRGREKRRGRTMKKREKLTISTPM